MGKHTGGVISSGHAKEDFGRGSAGQNIWKVREIEVQEEKTVRECEARHNQKNNRWLVDRKETNSS